MIINNLNNKNLKLNKIIYKNIVIVGDEFGIPMLLEKVPIELIKCVIVSGIEKITFNDF